MLPWPIFTISLTVALSICTWFLQKWSLTNWISVFFKLNFYCLTSLQKSISKFLQVKNPIHQAWFFKPDFSKIKDRAISLNVWTIVKKFGEKNEFGNSWNHVVSWWTYLSCPVFLDMIMAGGAFCTKGLHL